MGEPYVSLPCWYMKYAVVKDQSLMAKAIATAIKPEDVRESESVTCAPSNRSAHSPETCPRPTY